MKMVNKIYSFSSFNFSILILLVIRCWHDNLIRLQFTFARTGQWGKTYTRQERNVQVAGCIWSNPFRFNFISKKLRENSHATRPLYRSFIIPDRPPTHLKLKFLTFSFQIQWNLLYLGWRREWSRVANENIDKLWKKILTMSFPRSSTFFLRKCIVFSWI